MKLVFSASFRKGLEHVLIGAGAGFLAVIPATGTVNMTELKAAAIGAATGAFWAFAKQFGVNQTKPPTP